MNTMHYKGYTGSVEYSEADHCFVGEVLGLEIDSITYEGNNIDELRADFEDGVESYFESCEEIGIAPRKPATYLGVNIPAEVHKQIMLLAEQKKVSVDGHVEEALIEQKLKEKALEVASLEKENKALKSQILGEKSKKQFPQIASQLK
jgi:predicted HicB family RNase H-like nuclease